MTTKPAPRSIPAARSSLEPLRPRGPDANALELLARVVAAGSFAGAARQLGLTRAAISRRVLQVEAEVGQTLFVRSTRSLGLTDAGRRLAVRARAVLEAAESARRGLRARAAASGVAGLTGTLRITTVPLFGQSVLGPLLARFQSQHPALRIELRITPRRVDLAAEDIDVAFRLTGRPPEDTVATAVLPFTVHAYAAPAPGLPLDQPAALAGHRCLLLGSMRGAGTGDEVPTLWIAAPAAAATGSAAPAAAGRRGRGPAPPHAAPRRAGVTLQPAIVADDLGTLQAVARAGGGIVLAPDFCVIDDLAAGRLIDALPGWRLPVPEGEAVQALTLPLAQAPESARALVRFVREALGARGAGPA